MLLLSPLLLLPVSAWCAPATVDALLQSLARPAPASTPFVEVRFSRLLARPLIVSGTLQYLGPGRLVRTVSKPFHERTEIDGGSVTVQRTGEPERHFSLRRAPQLRGLLESFSAVLGGERATLERQFALDLHGGGATWTVVLTPRSARIRRYVSYISITGSSHDTKDGRDAQNGHDAKDVHDTEPRCLTSAGPHGETSVILLGEAATDARLPHSPDRAWLQSYCRGPRS